MPARRARQFPRRSSAPNRSWAGFNTASPVVVAAGTKVLLATLVLSNPGIDETVLRNVGVVSIQSDQSAATEQQIGAFGMIQVTDIAAAAGVASIPGPITDGTDDGWFTYVPFAQAFQFKTGVGFQGNVAQLYQFDSKARRRTSEGQLLAMVVENAHATHGLQIAVVLRTLSMVSGT